MVIKNRSVYLTGEINFESVNRIIQDINFLIKDNASEIIELYISSIGGSIMAAFSLHDFIKICGAPIATIGMGEVSSAALAVWLAATKGRPKATKNTFFVMHETSRTQNGSYKTSEIDTLATHQHIREKRLFEIMAGATKISLRKIEKAALADTLLDVESAIKFGLLRRQDIISF